MCKENVVHASGATVRQVYPPCINDGGNQNGAIRQREARDSWRGAPRDARYCSGVEPKKKKNYGNLKTETFRVLDVAYVQGGAYLFKNVGGPRATRLTAWLCMLSDIDG